MSWRFRGRSRGRRSRPFEHGGSGPNAGRPGLNCSTRGGSVLPGLIVVILLAGCHAPKPSFNVLAPYGSPRVPPPPTGAVGTSSDYYSSPSGAAAAQNGSAQDRSNIPSNSPAPSGNTSSGATPGASSPSGSKRPTGSNGGGTRLQMGSPPDQFMGTENDSDGNPGQAVKPASYSTGTASADSQRATRPRSNSGSSTLQLNGMPVSEATSTAGSDNTT